MSTTSQNMLAAVYAAAADDIENRHYNTFIGGPDVWSAMFVATNYLLAGPALEGLRRRLKVDQVQFWRADQTEVVKTLRDLAGDPEQLDLLQEADADNRIAWAAKLLREAVGAADDEGAFERIVGEVAHKLRRLETENTRLAAEVQRLTQSAKGSDQAEVSV